MNEATKAAKALLFFCNEMDPKRQWERAVELLLPMNHMEKARVWNEMTASENISDINLSRRRTAYKRALKAVEEERRSGVDQVNPHSNVSLDHNLLRFIGRLYKKNGDLSDELIKWVDTPGNKPIRNVSGLSDSSEITDLSTGEISDADKPVESGQLFLGSSEELQSFIKGVNEELGKKMEKKQTEMGEALRVLINTAQSATNSELAALREGVAALKAGLEPHPPPSDAALEGLKETVKSVETKMDGVAATVVELRRVVDETKLKEILDPLGRLAAEYRQFTADMIIAGHDDGILNGFMKRLDAIDSNIRENGIGKQSTAHAEEMRDILNLYTSKMKDFDERIDDNSLLLKEILKLQENLLVMETENSGKLHAQFQVRSEAMNARIGINELSLTEISQLQGKLAENEKGIRDELKLKADKTELDQNVQIFDAKLLAESTERKEANKRSMTELGVGMDLQLDLHRDLEKRITEKMKAEFSEADSALNKKIENTDERIQTLQNENKTKISDELSKHASLIETKLSNISKKHEEDISTAKSDLKKENIARIAGDEANNRKIDSEHSIHIMRVTDIEARIKKIEDLSDTADKKQSKQDTDDPMQGAKASTNTRHSRVVDDPPPTQTGFLRKGGKIPDPTAPAPARSEMSRSISPQLRPLRLSSQHPDDPTRPSSESEPHDTTPQSHGFTRPATMLEYLSQQFGT